MGGCTVYVRFAGIITSLFVSFPPGGNPDYIMLSLCIAQLEHGPDNHLQTRKKGLAQLYLYQQPMYLSDDLSQEPVDSLNTHPCLLAHISLSLCVKESLLSSRHLSRSATHIIKRARDTSMSKVLSISLFVHTVQWSGLIGNKMLSIERLPAVSISLATAR